MKAVAALLVLCSLAQAQNVPKLSPAKPVDILVRSVQWHPNGQALLYSRDEESGVGIGLFQLSDQGGKVVLHLDKEDRWSAKWFEGSTFALITVYRKVQTASGEGKEGDVYLLDAKQKMSYEIFARTVGPNEPLSIDADLSPALTHAIFDIHEGKQTYHMVLPNNGGKLVASNDIDQATQQGFTGPAWSKNGTAIYSNSASVESKRTKAAADGARFVDLKETQKNVNAAVEERMKVQYELALADLSLMLVRREAPAAGTPVLEVVPSNGVLRQVLSPGPWVDSKRAAATVQPRSHSITIDYGRSRGAANSLWLVMNDGAGKGVAPVKPDALGVMVAAHATTPQLAPGETAISYITDDALFVRLIEKGDR